MSNYEIRKENEIKKGYRAALIFQTRDPSH
jgi:ATP sulfurylase